MQGTVSAAATGHCPKTAVAVGCCHGPKNTSCHTQINTKHMEDATASHNEKGVAGRQTAVGRLNISVGECPGTSHPSGRA